MALLLKFPAREIRLKKLKSIVRLKAKVSQFVAVIVWSEVSKLSSESKCSAIKNYKTVNKIVQSRVHKKVRSNWKIYKLDFGKYFIT